MNKKGNFVILALIIVLVGLIFGIWYMVNNQESTKIDMPEDQVEFNVANEDPEYEEGNDTNASVETPNMDSSIGKAFDNLWDIGE